MKLFEQRGRAFETKFVHDSEIDFRARVRAFRFLAVWASTLKGETVAQARKFARSMVDEDIRHVGDETVVHIALKYLGNLTDEATVRMKIKEFFYEAKDLLELEDSIREADHVAIRRQ